MHSLRRRTVAALACAAAATGTVVLAQRSGEPKPQPSREETAAALRGVLEANLRAARDEDLPAAMATLHTRCPSRALNERTLRRLFAAYDLKIELLSFAYVGRDGDYAVVRFKQKTTKVSGPAFRDNIVDSMQVLRLEGDAWKLWTVANLEVTYPKAPSR
jgi:hypothetical protein